jgi:radical SAM enzyme (TIGR01210 family)
MMDPVGSARRWRGEDNPFLRAALLRLRRDRPRVPADRPAYALREQVSGTAFGRVWFTSRGCRWERRGSCTMCSYGTSPDVDEDTTVAAVAAVLDSLPPVQHLFVAPSGSMLDDQEVAPTLRRRILRLAASHPGVEALATEARPEDVTPVTIRTLEPHIVDRAVAVGLGLESASPLVLRFSVGKLTGRGAFAAAAERLHAHGIRVHMNVSLGSAFLDERTAIEDAAASIRWALANGADEVVVFPLHVRRGTLLFALHELRAYQPPSLWSVAEVLRRLPPPLLERTQVAWYRVYNDDGGLITASPTTCPACETAVLRGLDDYRVRPSTAALEALLSVRCGCRDRWASLVRSSSPELRTAILEGYDRLADFLGLAEQWASDRPVAVRLLERTPA